MSGKVLRGVGPRHLKSRKGKGWRECEATGFIGYAENVTTDVRQGRVQTKYADTTPGFGTHHPQDVRNLGVLDDPSPVPNGRTADTENASKQDLNISDQEIKLSIQEGRAPRMGY